VDRRRDGFGAEVFDAQSGELMKFVKAGTATRSVAVSPDGSLLVIGMPTARSSASRPMTGTASDGLSRPTQRASGCSSSRPTERRLATAGADGAVAIWDVATRKPIGTPLTLWPGSFVSAAFSPDGSHLFAVSTRGEGARLDASPEGWKRHACLVAGRDLSVRSGRNCCPSARIGLSARTTEGPRHPASGGMGA
jgi:WD40 repeat protein